MSGAAGYTIYKLGNKYMEPIGTTTATNFVVTGTNPALGYWFSVCANTPAGNKGRRAYAIYKAPGTSNCPLPFDVKLTSVASPAVVIYQVARIYPLFRSLFCWKMQDRMC